MVRLVDTTDLTPREFAFAEAMLGGMNMSDALRHAYPELIKKWKPQSINHKAHKMAHDPRIAAYIEGQKALAQRRRQIKESELLTRIEKRAILADCARDDRGEWPHRMAAIKIDNEMSGDALQRVEEELALGLILERLGQAQAIPTEDERRQLTGPVIDIPAAQSVSITPQDAPKQPIRGPYDADFESEGVEIALGLPNRLKQPIVREYED